MIRTFKEDLIYPQEFTGLTDFVAALSRWKTDYNTEFPHSSLGYFTPYEYERWFFAAQATAAV